MKISRTRKNLYRTARLLGDIDAISKGPTAMGKRVVRRAVGRSASRILSGRLLK